MTSLMSLMSLRWTVDECLKPAVRRERRQIDR